MTIIKRAAALTRYFSVFGSSFYVCCRCPRFQPILCTAQATVELQIRGIYDVNAAVASSGLTVYVLGFSLGPLLCEHAISILIYVALITCPVMPGGKCHLVIANTTVEQYSGPMSEMYGRRLPYLVSWALLIGL